MATTDLFTGHALLREFGAEKLALKGAPRVRANLSSDTENERNSRRRKTQRGMSTGNLVPTAQLRQRARFTDANNLGLQHLTEL